MPYNAHARLSPWPHRWAWALACATFPLIWWGGLVTATGSGMAFRDWLTSDGVPMPFYNWFAAAGDKFIEHGHRLLGMLAGILTIAVVASVHRAAPRRSVRWFSLALLAGVLAQGVLGGMRVVLDERVLALIHGCVGPAFFAATAAMVAVTSPHWRRETPAAGQGSAALFRLAVVTAALAYLQLVVGAVVRHSPLMTTERAAGIFQAAVYFHVLLAVAVVGHVLWLAWRSKRTAGRLPAALAGLVLVQFLLGLSAWVVKYGLPGWAQAFGPWNYSNTEGGALRAGIVTTHGAVGALIVALCVVVALHASRGLKTTGQRLPTTGGLPVGAPA